MKNTKYHLTEIVRLFAILSSAAILFNLAAVHIYKEPVFIDRATYAPIEFTILLGFAVVFLFVILSIVWLFNKTRESEKFAVGNVVMLLYGVFCLVTFVGQKVMADEIGRELRLGGEVLGELIILTILFVIQFVYSLLIIFRVRPEKAITN